jgi:hypothetical protein
MNNARPYASDWLRPAAFKLHDTLASVR